VNRLEWTLIAFVLAHLVAVVTHSIAHSALQITPEPADTVFIVAVIMVAPVAALPVLRFHRLLASGLLVVAMVAAFAYGFQAHFLVPGPDHVAVVSSDPWTVAFGGTAAVIGAFEVAAALVAATLFSRTIRTPSGPGEPSG
jgi:uncharacterized membrane protein YhaH (DUF805 family)